MNDYVKFRIGSFISRRLPLKFSYWIAMRISDYFFYHNRTMHDGVLANLARIIDARGIDCGQSTLDDMGRKTFQYFGKYLVDFFRYSASSFEKVRHLICIERLAYLDQARAEGRGVILLTAHIGNWELGGLTLASMGYPLSAVFQPMGSARVDEMFHRRRSGRGITVIPRGGAVRGLMKALQRKEVVALLADRDYSTHRDRFSFFGAPARLPTGPARLALKTGAPIVPGFMLRQVDDHFLLRFYPPIYPEAFGSVDKIVGEIARIMESVIGENMHQWYFFDDFWKDAEECGHAEGS